MRVISRRQALALLAGTGAAIGLGVVAVRERDDDAAAPDTAPPLPLGDIAFIGERYLRTHPTEASAEALTRAVGVENEANPFRVLQDRIHDDLDRGEVVVVDGWVLARTEARLCALAALDA